MMKILVFSDSHGTLGFMDQCIDELKPNAVIHLGDYFRDALLMERQYPHIYFYRVPGNCDRYDQFGGAPETLITTVCGVKLFMTHGHNYYVKTGLDTLIAAAHQAQVQAVLFGHTHQPLCLHDSRGMWVFNPGSCGYHGTTAGLITVEDKKISDCRIIRQSDL